MGPSRQSRITATALIGGVVLWLALAVPPVSAEWFADLYLGGAFTDKSDVKDDSPTGETTLKHIRFNRSSGYGVQAAAGLVWQFYPHVALFAEYRYTHFSPEFTFRTPPGSTRLRFDLDTRYPLAGISVRF